VPSSREPYLTAKLQGFGTTIFAEMSALAVATGSINLGQGFPDTDGPREVLDAAIDAINGGLNQYPPGPGMAVLREAIAEHQQRFYGVQYDPDTEVLVTAGATEALAGALLGMLDTGDEVVVFEPMYDSYQACIAMAGAIAKPVLLRPPTYGSTRTSCAPRSPPKTKLILLNTPHNPTGKVFTREETATHRRPRHRARPDRHHRRGLRAPRVRRRAARRRWRRCPACASARSPSRAAARRSTPPAGRSVGCAGRPAGQAARTAKQFLTYVNGGPFQPAIAVGLGCPTRSSRARRRPAGQARPPAARAGRAGFTVYPTSGTYFVTVDIRPLRPDGDGMAFCRALPQHCGVVAIPNEVLYANKAEGRHLVRFAFCKRLDVLDEAVTRLQSLGNRAR
jgi:N-succinyldiaminopimelate aminotransferase